MRFTVNLARAPRENRRRVWVLWGGACCLAAVVLVVLAVLSVHGWRAAASVRARASLVQARIVPLQRQRSVLAAALGRPGNRAAVQRAQYLNQLIDQKAVSWTRLFERLEALLPAQVQLLSIRPGEQQGQTALQLVVAAPSLAAALPFVRQLEEAPDFASPHVSEVNSRPAAGGGTAEAEGAAPFGVRLAIVADYNPRLGPADLPDTPGTTARAAAAGRHAAAQLPRKLPIP